MRGAHGQLKELGPRVPRLTAYHHGAYHPRWPTTTGARGRRVGALGLVECVELGHVLVGQGEVEDLRVLADSFPGGSTSR